MAVFKVKVTAPEARVSSKKMALLSLRSGSEWGFLYSCNQNMTVCTVSSKWWVLLQVNLVWWHNISPGVLGNDYCVQGQGHSIYWFPVSMNVYPYVFWIAWPFLIKFSIVIHHHELEHHLKTLICYLTSHIISGASSWAGTLFESIDLLSLRS